MINLLVKIIRSANRTFLCGNGGSAANALHWSNDLISVGIKAHALTGDVATLTAIANDWGYEYVFARQLHVLAEKDDLLIALSGSGKSDNILRALEAAKEIGLTSVAIVGAFNNDTPAERRATHTIRLGLDMQCAEEHQLILVHQVWRELKEK